MTARLRRQLRRFCADERGAVVVDYIPVFFFLILLVLLIFEIGIAYFLSLRAYKAAQLGARVATVLPAVHSGVPTINQRRNPLGSLGEPCFNPGGVDRCVDPGGPWICTGSNLGGECNEGVFNLIVADMQRTFPDLTASEVTIAYIYRRLGETGGPLVPEVNVSIQQQAYEFVMFTLGSNASGRSDGQLAAHPATRYGGVSASAFAENTSDFSIFNGGDTPPIEAN